MEFRKSRKSDLRRIMEIIEQAQDYFKSQKIDQWQNGYPNPQVIEEDIENGYSYVLLENEKILASTALSFDGEETYETIYKGEWLNQGVYAVIHRLAVDNSFKGLGLSSKIIEEVEKICIEKDISSIRVDTQEENIAMQKLLKKNDFKYCGIIYLEDKSKRIAFEKQVT